MRGPHFARVMRVFRRGGSRTAPAKHGYVAKWTDWPWSSAAEYLEEAGTEEAARLWKTYPIDRYGSGWDDADL